MNVKARVASCKDAEAVFGLWKEFQGDLGSKQDEIAEVSHRWGTRLKQLITEGKVIIVECNGRAVGFLGFTDNSEVSWVPKGTAFLTDLFVLPEARRTGAALKLLRFSIEHTGRIYRTFWTNTAKDNKRMRKLLLWFGFEETDEFCLEGFEDHLFYRKRI